MLRQHRRQSAGDPEITSGRRQFPQTEPRRHSTSSGYDQCRSHQSSCLGGRSVWNGRIRHPHDIGSPRLARRFASCLVTDTTFVPFSSFHRSSCPGASPCAPSPSERRSSSCRPHHRHRRASSGGPPRLSAPATALLLPSVRPDLSLAFLLERCGDGLTVAVPPALLRTPRRSRALEVGDFLRDRSALRHYHPRSALGIQRGNIE